MIVPRKERCTKANFLDLNIMELLDTKVRIDFPRLMIKNMQRVLFKDGKGHVLPYEFWLTLVFEDYSVPIQVWSL